MVLPLSSLEEQLRAELCEGRVAGAQPLNGGSLSAAHRQGAEEGGTGRRLGAEERPCLKESSEGGWCTRRRWLSNHK